MVEYVHTDVFDDLSTASQIGEDWRLVSGTKIEVHPSWRTIIVTQDKYDQKEQLMKHDLPTARSVPLKGNSVSELAEVGEELGYPFMLKSRTDAYSSRGDFAVRHASELQAALEAPGPASLRCAVG